MILYICIHMCRLCNIRFQSACLCVRVFQCVHVYIFAVIIFNVCVCVCESAYVCLHMRHIFHTYIMLVEIIGDSYVCVLLPIC